MSHWHEPVNTTRQELEPDAITKTAHHFELLSDAPDQKKPARYLHRGRQKRAADQPKQDVQHFQDGSCLDECRLGADTGVGGRRPAVEWLDK